MHRGGGGTIDPTRVLGSLPPLIKGYLRLGGGVGDGAVIDADFNTIDIAIVVRTGQITGRYLRHYDRELRAPAEWQPVCDTRQGAEAISG
jgi:putative hemolysin